MPTDLCARRAKLGWYTLTPLSDRGRKWIALRTPFLALTLWSANRAIDDARADGLVVEVRDAP